MKDIDSALQETIARQLGAQGLDFDLIPIPAKGDREIRLRSIEEILDELDSTDGAHGVGYLIQVKPRTQAPHPQAGVVTAAPEPNTSIYLPDGRLNAPFLMRNAELLYTAGDYALARNIFETIRKSGLKTSQSLLWIGRCFEAEKKFDDARKNYEGSITYDPSLDSMQALGSVLVRMGKDQEAAEVLERALGLREISPKTRLEIHKAAGNCWLRSKFNDRAESNYLKALELDPSADEIHANLGALYLQDSKYGEAARYFQAAIGANSKNAKALAGLGSCALALGQKREAHDLFAKSLDIELTNPNALFQLVKCAYEIKSFATAARICEAYTEVAPVSVHLLYSLSGLQYHLGRMAEAMASVRRILMLQPNHAGARELEQLIQRYSTTQ